MTHKLWVPQPWAMGGMNRFLSQVLYGYPYTTNNQTLDICLFETVSHKVHYFFKNQYLVLVTIMQF